MKTRSYEKADVPAAPPPPQEELPIVTSFAILPETTPRGRKLWTVVAIQTQGDRVVNRVIVPEGTWSTFQDARKDAQRCLGQVSKGNVKALLAGRV